MKAQNLYQHFQKNSVPFDRGSICIVSKHMCIIHTTLCHFLAFTGNFLPAAKLSKIFPSSFTVVYINVNIGYKQYIKIVTLKTFYVHGFRRYMYCIVNILLFPNGYCISYIYFQMFYLSINLDTYSFAFIFLYTSK